MSTITEIQITPIKPRDGLVAFASCVIDNEWYLGNIAIYTRLNGGHRLLYPTKKIGEQNIPIFHPVSKDAGENTEKAIIGKLEELWTNQTTNE